MEFMVGDKVRVISGRRPTGFGMVRGYEGIISNIWSEEGYRGRHIEIEFFDDELRNFINGKGIMWETRELELV